MVRDNAVITSFVLGVTDDGRVLFQVVLDPAFFVDSVKTVVRSSSKVVGFVAIYDGQIVEPGQPRREALLLVRGEPADQLYGRAYPYERTPFGARFDDSREYLATEGELKRFKGIL